MKVFEITQFGLDHLKLAERPEPKPGHGQVKVKLRAVSLNYRDLLVIKGHYNPRQKFPLIPVSDGAGEIVEVGPGVTRFQVGQRVAGCFMQDWVDGPMNDARAKSSLGAGANDGLLAEYAVLQQCGVVPVPSHLSDEEAATLPCAALTAWNALITSGNLKAGDVILTQGTGGVSLFAVQFARMAGARVIITSSSDEKLERARKLGATDTINYKTTTDWDEKARELTGNHGVDHIVELGGAGTLPKSLRAIRSGGRISLIGVLSGGGEINPMAILMKCVCVQGIYVGSRAMFEAMNRAIGQQQLRPVVDRAFPFAEAPAAFRHLESGQHFGKVCIRIG
jgi:NADPH:quinone reductase-like Zn-dependent oxidoreductase